MGVSLIEFSINETESSIGAKAVRQFPYCCFRIVVDLRDFQFSLADFRG